MSKPGEPEDDREKKLSEIWKGDHLFRRQDAADLIDYLIGKNERAVSIGERGVSMNISARWGAGKTFFVSRMAEQLRQDGYKVAMVDAWRDDHAEDPVFAVMSAVLDALGGGKKAARLKTVLKEQAGKIAIRSIKGLAQRTTALVIGQEAATGIGDDIVKGLAAAADEAMDEYAANALKRFEEGKAAIAKFRDKLTKELTGTKPLFVFVDELDRCRPTYSVQLLERIKHLFDVPNVIFLVATNTEQLAHTIRAVYGAAFDAERYLLRFFDRTYTFDEPLLEEFIKDRSTKIGLSLDDFSEPAFGVTNVLALAAFSAQMRLSLRDIDQCLDIIWSVARLIDRPDGLKIPLLYLFPLVASYHTGQQEAFAFASGAAYDSDWEKSVSAFFTQDAAFTVARSDSLGRNTHDEEVTLYSLMDQFRTLIQRGLRDSVGEGNSFTAIYVERCREREFHLLHNNTFYPGAPVRTQLKDYSALVKRAGRRFRQLDDSTR